MVVWGELQAPISVSEFFDRFAELFKTLNILVIIPVSQRPKYSRLSVRVVVTVWHTTCIPEAWIETVVPIFTDGEYI